MGLASYPSRCCDEALIRGNFGKEVLFGPCLGCDRSWQGRPHCGVALSGGSSRGYLLTSGQIWSRDGMGRAARTVLERIVAKRPDAIV